MGIKMGMQNKTKRLLLAGFISFSMAIAGTTLGAVGHAEAASYLLPTLVAGPGVPPPIPNAGAGSAANSVVYPGQQMSFLIKVKNTGDTVSVPTGTQGKRFFLDPNNGNAYYLNDPACGGNCYNNPDTTPWNYGPPNQPGLDYTTGAGFVHNWFVSPGPVAGGDYDVPALAPGAEVNVGWSPPAPDGQAPPAGYTFTYVVPAGAAVGRKICIYAHVYQGPGDYHNTGADGANGITGVGVNCFIVGSISATACGNMTTSPATLDPGMAYQVSASVDYGSASAANFMKNSGQPFYIKVISPSGATIVNIANAITSVNGSSLTGVTPTQGGLSTTGTYTVQYGVTGPTGAINCSKTFSVAKRPYFKAIGDIAAGVGMSVNGADCASSGGIPVNQNAGIVSWNTGAPNYSGAGATFAALALNHLQSFVSGQGGSYAPSGLAFANIGGGPGQIDAGQQLYGGKFNGGNCVADFWKNATSVLSGDQTIGPLVIPNGTKQVIYVDGKVTITGNITFSGNYATAADIPSFTIVSRGNIYVDKGVTQMDGFYIAAPQGGATDSGKFKTCAIFWYTPAGLDKNLQSTCDTALTINGAVVSKQAWLNRTAGTMSGSAAETFNYSPEFWITAPYGNGLTPATDKGYDSITSLPPVL
jgi:hypothetical protein